MIVLNFFEKRIMKQISVDSANPRMDNAKQKRVELHTHSKMSDMDGVCSAAVLVKQAFVWGHMAIAVTDHGNVQAFPEVMGAIEQIRAYGGDIKPIYGMEGYLVNDGPPDIDLKKQPIYHITILVKNKIGLKNLYRLVSLSNLNYFYKKPRIPFSELKKYREGLIIGSGSAESELFRAMLDGKSQEEIDAVAEKYDYFEIQPAASDLHKTVNKKIVKLADKHGKLCAATGDVHFLNEEDGIFRKIIRTACNDDNADDQPPLFFRTTDEMLSEFGYLGAEKALEVVVTNTNAIANMIEANIRPIPKGAFTPLLPEAETEFSRICWESAHAHYGVKLPVIVEKRLKRELEPITKYGFSSYYMTAKKLVECSERNGYPVSSRGSVGSTLTAFLSGITDIDPLPPHYVCPKCKRSEFITDGSVSSGFDLPRKNCPECGCEMERNGHDIPFETFMGFNGWKTPSIDLDFSPEIIETVKRTARELFGEDRVFTAGAISVTQPKTARDMVEKYCDLHGVSFNKPETERLIEGCTNVKRTTSIRPGIMIVIPEGYEPYDFTPLQYAADKTNGSVVTQFDFRNLEGLRLPVEILGSNAPALYKRLEDMTGVKKSDVPTDDPLVYKLFTSTEPLKLSEDIGIKCGTLGIPEFGSDFIMQMMIEAQPKTFFDLIKIFGLAHGRNTWDGNARDLIKDNICGISDVIATRDDVMLYLTRKGFSQIEAYNIAEITRVGSANEMFDDEIYNDFEKHDIPEWFAESCKKTGYLLPKAHAVARAAAAVRQAWFKLHFPSEFYAAVLENQVHNPGPDVITKGREAVKARVEELRKSLDNSGSYAKKSKLDAYLLVWELMARGVEMPKSLSL